MNKKPDISTLGELRGAKYHSKTIKDELRDNLIASLKSGKKIFEGIVGYDDTVIPEIERAILSKHNINLLGLRGQAKTRIARQLVGLLDEWIPVVKGSELNDDPFNPVSTFAKHLIAEMGDKTPVEWLHSNERYAEKLATPDVSVADMIGDLDPIKAANLKLNFSDERVIHFGIIPRSNRCIFVINELPDLQARIQVALFNILQEGDVQIRGFKLRLNLDIQFVFTANPEDYTNRGSIITPLKDRIGSQILTHYPKSVEQSKLITNQEAKLSVFQKEKIIVSDLLRTLIELIAVEARNSEFVDAKSGVSARLTIAVFETLVSAAERRMLINNEGGAFARISDLFATVAAINGKIELVYEGEQEGAAIVAQSLISKAIRSHFLQLFTDPSKLKKKNAASPYQSIVDWFNENNCLDMMFSENESNYKKLLNSIPGLDEVIDNHLQNVKGNERLLMKEFLLHGLAEHSVIGKNVLERAVQFKDTLGSIFSGGNFTMDESEFN